MNKKCKFCHRIRQKCKFKHTLSKSAKENPMNVNIPKSTILFALLGAIALSLPAIWFFKCRKAAANNHPNDSLVVGMIIGYVPYAALTPSGQYEGFDVEIAHLIAKKLNKTLIIKDMDLSALLIALNQNRLDMVMTNCSITAEREKLFTMIHYTGEKLTSFPLVFWEKIPKNISSIDDLITYYPNDLICVEPGSTQEKYLITKLNNNSIIKVESIADIMMNLQYKKVLAAFMDPDIMPTLKKQQPKLVSIEVNLPKEYQSNGAGICINKQNSELANKIGTIIAELKNDGSIKQAEKVWLNK